MAACDVLRYLKVCLCAYEPQPDVRLALRSSPGLAWALLACGCAVRLGSEGGGGGSDAAARQNARGSCSAACQKHATRATAAIQAQRACGQPPSRAALRRRAPRLPAAAHAAALWRLSGWALRAGDKPRSRSHFGGREAQTQKSQRCGLLFRSTSAWRAQLCVYLLEPPTVIHTARADPCVAAWRQRCSQARAKRRAVHAARIGIRSVRTLGAPDEPRGAGRAADDALPPRA